VDAALSNLKYRPVLSNVEADDPWPGRKGWVTTAALVEEGSLAQATVYASGPPAMIDAIRHGYRSGTRDGSCLFDSFDYRAGFTGAHARETLTKPIQSR